jgi:FtsZ-binding cell division protein ZapB
MVPEYEIDEAELIEELESVTGMAVAEPAPNAAEPALPEFTEETMVPEYEIDDAELIEELETVKGIDLQKSFPDAAPAFPEFVEETVVPEPEEPVEQPIPIFPEPSETELPREVPRVAVQPFPAEKTDELSDTVRELSEKMVRMTDTITLLRQTVSDLRTEVKALQYNIMPKKEQGERVPDFKDSNEFKELKREQKEITDLIKHIAYMLASIKEKKSWFKFKF